MSYPSFTGTLVDGTVVADPFALGALGQGVFYIAEEVTAPLFPAFGGGGPMWWWLRYPAGSSADRKDVERVAHVAEGGMAWSGAAVVRSRPYVPARLTPRQRRAVRRRVARATMVRRAQARVLEREVAQGGCAFLRESAVVRSRDWHAIALEDATLLALADESEVWLHEVERLEAWRR